MVDVASLISTCPAPVSTANGVENAVAWLALSAAWAKDVMSTYAHDTQPIKTRAYTYFDLIRLSTTDYADVNDKLYHVKDMLTALQSLSTT